MGYIEDLRAIIGHRRINIPGSVVIIVNSDGKILMQQRVYPYGKWGLPGGIMELGESTEEAARREVLEETGLTLGKLSLLGVYSGKNYLCKAKNEDEYYVVVTVYTAREFFGEVSVNDGESLALEWFGLDELPENIAHAHMEAIEDYRKLAYYAYGRAYLRVADEDKVMSPQELESYILKKNANKSSWDSELSDKTSADVSDEALIEYIHRANTAGRIGYSYTDKQDILKKLNLLNGEKITNTAKVMFCPDIALEVKTAVFATDERLTFNDIGRKSGTVTELVEFAEKYIRNNIHWRAVFNGSLQRKEIPEIPIEAVREALFNSFCHRNYKINQSNEVAIFKNRVEIYNPGTFPPGLTPQDFITGSERSIQRNPQLANVLYYSKDIEKFGTGLRRITDVCQAANVKVDFQMLKTGVAVVFYRS